MKQVDLLAHNPDQHSIRYDNRTVTIYPDPNSHELSDNPKHLYWETIGMYTQKTSTCVNCCLTNGFLTLILQISVLATL
jgi:hypothetical protein